MSELIKCSECGEEKEPTKFYGKKKQCIKCYNLLRKERRDKKKDDELSKNANVIDFSKVTENSSYENEEIDNSFLSFGTGMISTMMDDSLKSIFKILSKRLGDHWKIDNEEAQSISKPLINILSKSKLYSKLMENADVVALSTSLTFVVGDRIFTTIRSQKREEKTNDRTENNITVQTKQNKTSYTESNKGDEIKPDDVFGFEATNY